MEQTLVNRVPCQIAPESTPSGPFVQYQHQCFFFFMFLFPRFMRELISWRLELLDDRLY